MAPTLVVAAVLLSPAFMKHPDTGKFMPDDFNVTEIEERTKWEDTRPFIKCGVCRMIVEYLLREVSSEASGDDIIDVLEGVCEVPDEHLYGKYQITNQTGQWDVAPVEEPDNRRADIRKWHALSLRDTCTFTVLPHDADLAEYLTAKAGAPSEYPAADAACVHVKLCGEGTLRTKDEV